MCFMVIGLILICSLLSRLSFNFPGGCNCLHRRPKKIVCNNEGRLPLRVYCEYLSLFPMLHREFVLPSPTDSY